MRNDVVRLPTPPRGITTDATDTASRIPYLLPQGRRQDQPVRWILRAIPLRADRTKVSVLHDDTFLDHSTTALNRLT
jgi:hypothetical protein